MFLGVFVLQVISFMYGTRGKPLWVGDALHLYTYIYLSLYSLDTQYIHVRTCARVLYYITARQQRKMSQETLELECSSACARVLIHVQFVMTAMNCNTVNSLS